MNNGKIEGRNERDLAQSLKLLWVGGGAGIGNLVLPSTNSGSPKRKIYRFQAAPVQRKINNPPLIS